MLLKVYNTKIMEKQNEESKTDLNYIEIPETFEDMNLEQSILRGITNLSIQKPSEVLKKCIRHIISGKNIIAQAQSEKGKFEALAICILQLIDKSLNQCQALILTPTREFAQTVKRYLLEIGQYLDLGCYACIGGVLSKEDKMIIEKGCQIIVGTPLRIYNLISGNYLNTGYLKVFVLDDADEIFSRGFKDHIQDLLKLLPRNLQFCIFSETISADIEVLTSQFMTDPIKIIVSKKEPSLEGITQYYIPIEVEELKFSYFSYLYESMNITQVLIYVNSIKQVETLSKQISEKGHIVSFIHEDLDQTQRELMIRDFRTGYSRILISTDFGAKIIFVSQISLTINYDMPSNYEKYLFRVGRSGRFGRIGLVINFVLENENQFLRDIEQHFDTSIKVLPDDVSNLL